MSAGLRFCRIGSGRYGLWRSVRALEKRTGVGDRRAVLVSRLFLSPTPVHNSNATEPAGPGLWFTSENLSYPCSMMGV